MVKDLLQNHHCLAVVHSLYSNDSDSDLSMGCSGISDILFDAAQFWPFSVSDYRRLLVIHFWLVDYSQPGTVSKSSSSTTVCLWSTLFFLPVVMGRSSIPDKAKNSQRKQACLVRSHRAYVVKIAEKANACYDRKVSEHTVHHWCWVWGCTAADRSECPCPLLKASTVGICVPKLDHGGLKKGGLV